MLFIATSGPVAKFYPDRFGERVKTKPDIHEIFTIHPYVHHMLCNANNS